MIPKELPLDHDDLSVRLSPEGEAAGPQHSRLGWPGGPTWE